jgi:uncharacterized protein
MTSAFARMLPDGKRLHLQNGPIDLVISAEGGATEVALAFEQACSAFEPVLDDLVSELSVLRAPLKVACAEKEPSGPVANIMTDAAQKFADHNVTPMIAVAGSVADYILDKMTTGRKLDRVSVNNGGDIALYLGNEQSFDIGIVSRVDAPEISMKACVLAHDPVRGIATSGWRGRSFSLGVADAVTILAPTAALADAAATLIANEVDPGNCPEITRQTAFDLDPDNDLGDRMVTINVSPLSDAQVDKALQQGQDLAGSFVSAGHIVAAAMSLQGSTRLAGNFNNTLISNEPVSEKKYASG